MEKTLQELNNQVSQAYQRNDFSEALCLLQQRQSISGMDAELANAMAVLNYRLGNIDLSVELFRNAFFLRGE